ncbi:MAG TPA: hypothetical protein VGN37_21920 [Actinocatenispora sp.]
MGRGGPLSTGIGDTEHIVVLNRWLVEHAGSQAMWFTGGQGYDIARGGGWVTRWNALTAATGNTAIIVRGGGILAILVGEDED